MIIALPALSINAIDRREKPHACRRCARFIQGQCLLAGVAEAMARGVLRVFPEAEVRTLPIADGGEGTVEALVAATAGELRHSTVSGPLGEPVSAPGASSVMPHGGYRNGHGVGAAAARRRSPRSAPGKHLRHRSSADSRGARCRAASRHHRWLAAARPTTAVPAWRVRSACASSMRTARRCSTAAPRWPDSTTSNSTRSTRARRVRDHRCP